MAGLKLEAHNHQHQHGEKLYNSSDSISRSSDFWATLPKGLSTSTGATVNNPLLPVASNNNNTKNTANTSSSSLVSALQNTHSSFSLSSTTAVATTAVSGAGTAAAGAKKVELATPCFPVLILSFVDYLEVSDALAYLTAHRPDAVFIFAPQFIIGEWFLFIFSPSSNQKLLFYLILYLRLLSIRTTDNRN